MSALDTAISIVKRLREKGFIAYFAGGWVRDYLMGHPSSDIDIATNASPEQIIDLFSHTIPVGIAFGVVIVVEKGHHFEVATFRQDIHYLNGRTPEKIEFSTPEEDASRRDFTINGMFYDPLTQEIHDFVGGKIDLEKKIIQTIGNAHERFEEDRLRMIRAVRFASRFDFAIAPETDSAIRSRAHTLFPSVAIERVWQELSKMRDYPHFDRAITEMARLGLLQVIFPMLAKTPLEMIKQRVRAFSEYPSECPTILFIMKLFPEQPLKKWVEIGRYLKVKNADILLIEHFWKTHELMQKKEELVELCEWAFFYANPRSQLCLEAFLAELEAAERERLRGHHLHRQHLLMADIHRIEKKTPIVSSETLLNHGILPGKLMGQLLKEAERIAINQRHHYAEDVIRALQHHSQWPSST
jgi:poly(A) polymerase